MSCFRPIKGYIGPDGIFKPGSIRQVGPWGLRSQVPCGHCDGCRRFKRDSWAIRCHHEAKYHRHNSFITLTYDDEHLPYAGSLSRQHFDNFMKYLRMEIAPLRVRFFAAGEYGETYKRPHYHLLLFGYKFPDFKAAQTGKEFTEGNSAFLDRIWGKGFTSIGEMSYPAASYVAKYCIKRPSKKLAEENGLYTRIVGEKLVEVEPEFNTQSKMPGLGTKWIEEHWRDVYPADRVVIMTPKGPRIKTPPTFYDDWLRKNEPGIYAQVKLKRIEKTDPLHPEFTETRLAVRELAKRKAAGTLTKKGKM